MLYTLYLLYTLYTLFSLYTLYAHKLFTVLIVFKALTEFTGLVFYHY
jgi:hypothetical protein